VNIKKDMLFTRQWLAGSADGSLPRRTVAKYASIVESCKERQQDCKESQLKNVGWGRGGGVYKRLWDKERPRRQQVARRTPIDMGDGTAYDKVYEHGYAGGDRVGYVIIL
jgi:hypothetical protein